MQKTLRALNSVGTKLGLAFLLLAYLLVMSGTASAATAPYANRGSGFYSLNTNHDFRIYSGDGKWCDIRIAHGNYLTASYSKILKRGSSHGCTVGTRIHTNDSYPAGNYAETSSSWTWVQSCANNGACTAYTPFLYASHWVMMPNYNTSYWGPIIMEFDASFGSSYWDGLFQYGCWGECTF